MTDAEYVVTITFDNGDQKIEHGTLERLARLIDQTGGSFTAEIRKKASSVDVEVEAVAR